jgi:HSP20 family protein
MDIYEEGPNLMVKASVPGLKPEEIKIEVKGDVLHIYGETKKEEEKKERSLSTGAAGRQEPLHYHLKEHRFARYERSLVLPCEVSAEKAHAVFDNGMLTLTLPKTETTKTKQIPIKTLTKA